MAADRSRDLAILKVAGKNLAHLQLGDNRTLQVGDHVVAIGSPLGLESSVSDGIVSAMREEGAGKNWIQTTVPVSHGNSGGPLLDLNGSVVGVITWGVNLQLGQNLNFAIPCEAVKAVLATEHTAVPLAAVENGESASTAGPKAAPAVTRITLWTSLTVGVTTRSGAKGITFIRSGLVCPFHSKGHVRLFAAS